MPPAAARQATRVWILLVLLTAISILAGHSGTLGLAGNGIVLTVAVIKGWWMLMDFVKLRRAPSGWRIGLASWLVLVAGSGWIAAIVPLLRG